MEKVRAYSREKQREYYARNREKILAKRREQYDTKKLMIVAVEPNQDST